MATSWHDICSHNQCSPFDVRQFCSSMFVFYQFSFISMCHDKLSLRFKRTLQLRIKFKGIQCIRVGIVYHNTLTNLLLENYSYITFFIFSLKLSISTTFLKMISSRGKSACIVHGHAFTVEIISGDKTIQCLNVLLNISFFFI